MEHLLYLFLPFVQPFAANAWLTLLPVAFFALLWLKQSRTTGARVSVAVATLGWALYAAWEISFLFRPVREWIRIDLLAIAPLLVLISLWALIALYRHAR